MRKLSIGFIYGVCLSISTSLLLSLFLSLLWGPDGIFSFFVDALGSSIIQVVLVFIIMAYILPLKEYKNTGTTERQDICSYPWGTSTSTGKCPPDCMKINWTAWGNGKCEFTLVGSCKNPLETSAPNIDYNLGFVVSNTGQVRAYGQHDGFPNYEIYKKVNSGAFVPVYQYSHGSKTLAALAEPMDVKFDKTVK